MGRDWSGLTGVDAVQSDPHPPAKLAFLLSADRWPLDAATQPYGSAASIFRGGEPGLITRHFRMIVMPGAEHARYHAAVGYSSATAAAADIAATTAYGGIAGADPTRIATPFARARIADPDLQVQQHTHLSSDWQDDVPAANGDRLLELERLARPKVEPGSIANCCAFSVVVARHVYDLEGL